jgi:hypothetical protein
MTPFLLRFAQPLPQAPTEPEGPQTDGADALAPDAPRPVTAERATHFTRVQQETTDDE